MLYCSFCYLRHETPFPSLEKPLYEINWKSTSLEKEAYNILYKILYFFLYLDLALFIYLTLSYFFEYDEWLILIQHLFFIPQIVHNARAGNNPGFQPFYVLGYLGLRIFIPIYERSCPSNHFNLAPIPWIVITIIILYVIQVNSILFRFFCCSYKIF